jgi:hypothetical protein
MWEIYKSGFVRGVKLFYMAEYCDTLQSKEKRNWEHKACLNNKALRLLDHSSDKGIRTGTKFQGVAEW